MKTIVKLIALGAAIIAPFLTAPKAEAGFGGSLRSFNVTNVVSPSTAINSWPTNSLTTLTNSVYTNVVGQFTGTALEISQFDMFGLVVSGFNASTNNSATNVIGIGLVTSCANQQPAIVFGTNSYTPVNTNIISNDFSYLTNWIVFTIPSGVGAVTNGDQGFNVNTNLPSTYITAGATYVGIVSITNNGFNGGVITNFFVGLETKAIPKPIGY